MTPLGGEGSVTGDESILHWSPATNVQLAYRAVMLVELEVDPSHVHYPLSSDPELRVAKLYDMLPADAGDTCAGRTAADNATARSVFVIGPDKRIKAMLTYPMSSGRNFAEILRLLDSCQLTANEQVATPANRERGGDLSILPAASGEDARAKYPDSWVQPLPYIRLVPQPGA